MSPAPTDFRAILKQLRGGGDALNGLFEEKKSWLESVVLGGEDALPVALAASAAKRCLKHVNALLVPRTFKYANDETQVEDFLLVVVEDAVISEILRRDRENEVAQWRLRRSRADSEFGKILAAYQFMVRGRAYNLGVRDDHRLQEIANNVLMQIRASFDPLLGSFRGQLLALTRDESRHSQKRNDEPLPPGGRGPAVHAADGPLAGISLLVHDERLRMIAGLPKPAHKLLSFMFNHDLGWKPQAIVGTFGNETIREMFGQFVSEYAEWLDSDSDHVRGCLSELQNKLSVNENGKAVGDRILVEYLPPLAPGEAIRAPNQRVNDWSHETDKALKKAIADDEPHYLQIVFGGNRPPLESPREILTFAMIRLAGRKAAVSEPYMTEPMHDVLHHRFKPSYLADSGLDEPKLDDCMRGLMDAVALHRGGGVSYRPVPADDPEVWHDRIRSRVRDEITRPSPEQRCPGLLFAFVHRYL